MQIAEVHSIAVHASMLNRTSSRLDKYFVEPMQNYFDISQEVSVNYATFK